MKIHIFQICVSLEIYDYITHFSYLSLHKVQSSPISYPLSLG